MKNEQYDKTALYEIIKQRSSFTISEIVEESGANPFWVERIIRDLIVKEVIGIETYLGYSEKKGDYLFYTYHVKQENRDYLNGLLPNLDILPIKYKVIQAVKYLYKFDIYSLASLTKQPDEINLPILEELVSEGYLIEVSPNEYKVAENEFAVVKFPRFFTDVESALNIPSEYTTPENENYWIACDLLSEMKKIGTKEGIADRYTKIPLYLDFARQELGLGGFEESVTWAHIEFIHTQYLILINQWSQAMDIGTKVVDIFLKNNMVEYATVLSSQLSSLPRNWFIDRDRESMFKAEASQKNINELRELDQLKSQFLSNMSHELRTPLNSILGFTEILLEGVDGELTVRMRNDLELIRKSSQHILHLINDILDLAKIESGRMTLSPEKIKIREILGDVTKLTSELARNKNLSLSIEEDINRDFEIYADSRRIRQVMMNLISNAIKYTVDGNISIQVKPTEDANLLISIRDSGEGIPPDKLETIFQQFSQVESSTTRKVGGTGLGLWISRQIIEMHGGRLWAESTGVAGNGSTFNILLPLGEKAKI